MAHLTCVKHGKRSVVIAGVHAAPSVRHRTNHDSECDSNTLLLGDMIIDKYEVFNSQFESGVKAAIADNIAKAVFYKERAKEANLKSRLQQKFASPPLKRIRGRV